MAVIATGLTLVILAWPLSPAHFIKLGCVSIAVSANLACVYMVVRRKLAMDAGAGADALWKSTRQIVMSAVVGMPFAAVAVCVGFWLAYGRLLKLLG
jgi:hypothetical protein